MSEYNQEEEMIELLKQIRNWLRIGFHTDAKQLIQDILDDDKKRLAYQLADGRNSIETIRSKVGTSPNKVIALFNKCIELGLTDIPQLISRDSGIFLLHNSDIFYRDVLKVQHDGGSIQQIVARYDLAKSPSIDNPSDTG